MCTDMALWDPTSSATWCSLDFCLPTQQFNVHTIEQTQLTTLSQARGSSGIITVGVHPHQACLASLVEVAWCLVILANEGPDWPYAFIWKNNTILHMPLSSEGHFGILIECVPQRNPWGLLHQLQAWRLLQCREWVVCPEGLNVGIEALVFNFEDQPLWNMATVGEAGQDSSMIEVDLCSTKP